jgi:prepilin-type N-terminal cleavage/methylation domain-containing protein
VINKIFKSNKGWTLIELVIVIIIIGVLAVTMIPQFRGALNAIRLRTAKEKLIDDLYYAQHYAITNHRTVWFNAPTGNVYSYGIYDPEVVLTDLSTGDSAIIYLTSNVSISTGGFFEFDWWGIPVPGGGNDIILNGSETITITSETGFIHVP